MTIEPHSWDLDGDGEYDDASGVQVSRRFPANGTFPVGVQVSDGHVAATAGVEVVVHDLGPHAAFAGSPSAPTEGEAVEFRDGSASDPDALVAWSWSFGSLGTSSGQSPSFSFPENGTYSVTLTVTDSDGSKDTIAREVIVARSPGASATARAGSRRSRPPTPMRKTARTPSASPSPTTTAAQAPPPSRSP